ncbi:MAG: NADH-quinone oxidoreductase subunit M [Cyanobacteriota bacterium]|nr:NADH-quinone oxidoreductase subunit M [Cyanobacteriota bacterium]
MLSILILVPIVGAILISLLPTRSSPQLIRSIALVVALLDLAWTGVVIGHFQMGIPGIQLGEYQAWIPPLGLVYELGVDGLSLPLLVLNNLLVMVAVWSSVRTLQRPRFYYSLILLLQAGVVGAFLAQNLLLFFLFYEVELIPLYLLIAIWGGSRRGYASAKFLIYTAFSGILLLAAFFGITWLSGTGSFSLAVLRQHSIPLPQQLLLLLPLLLGLGIKIPLVPLHTWLPDAHVEASTPVSVLLAGILLKLGTYGLIRFGLDLLPEGWQVLAPWLAALAVVNVIYGSLNALAQQDMKKLVAYGSVAHMGYVLLAVAAATPLSLLGSVFQMVSHGLISALLFLLVGAVYTNTGTRDLRRLQGLLNPERGLPLVGSLMILGVMASAGTPGMVGFIAEFIVFRSSFEVFPVQTLLCMLGTGLTAAYFLLLVNRAFFGRLSDQAIRMPRRQLYERLPAAVLAVVVVLLGLQPNWILDWVETTTSAIALAHSHTPLPLAGELSGSLGAISTLLKSFSATFSLDSLG